MSLQPRDELAQIRAENQAMREKIALFDRQPSALVTVIAMPTKGKGVLSGTPPQEIPVPANTKVGTQLRIVPGTSVTVEVLPEPVSFGAVLPIAAVESGRVLVTNGSSQSLLPVAEGLKPKPGDRAVLDPMGGIVLKLLPDPAAPAAFELSAAKRVSWDDIGGQEEAKQALREAIEYPVMHADVYKAHGQKPAKGAVLYGAPGTGKSLLARALATSIAGDTGGFIYVKATEVMTKWQGESGGNVRAMFKRGRDFQAKTGKRAVLFIDEADALLPVRDGHGVKISGGSEDMVPVFLAEMDGLDELGPFVLLATNRVDRIDPAVLRDGRCETKVHVRRPDRASCEAIFRLALRGRNVAEVLQNDTAAQATELLWGERLIVLELSYPGIRTSEYVRLSDLVSGAMIEGIVQRAAAVAIRRDRESGSISLLGLDDLEAAIKETLRQQARVNHEQVIAEKSASFGKMPEKVRVVVNG